VPFVSIEDFLQPTGFVIAPDAAEGAGADNDDARR
jgi:hypothetical protein